MKIKFGVFIICFLIGSFAFSQRKPKIRGSKVVVEVHKDLEPFDSIELEHDLDINFVASADYGLSLVIDDNLVDVLEFRVVDHVLSIDSYYNITAKKKLEITVFYNQIHSLILRDGKINIEDVIETDYLNVTSFNSSKISLNANVNLLEVDMSDNSFANLIVNVDSLNVSLKDRADARIYADAKTANVNLKKNSELKLKGKAEVLNAHLFDSSDLKAENFDTSDTNLFIKKNANAYVRAKEVLNLSSSDSANTYFYGNGAINIIEFLNTSQLNKRDDVLKIKD
ncbi:DUF2807 domain-containing protein [Cellulophaga baltica]|uniref:GIN domain-containing protein n=1 Tax=Cellulophaga TaxID=104264 RepID=UPI001C07740A|nr:MULTISPECIES: DUF2807 domain-containing protein [Cellulophaga]MBU2997198.1 DUF2807 domain-containing protein [Cellulophaga baltica]MDO6768596.1 DUF2807 domain-containing protein [Cellulophaga sp. 1_MG-2023]